MTKRAKKRTAVRFTTPLSNRPKPSKAGQKGNRVAAGRSGTKHSAAIEMLRSPNGATIAALTRATGWQSHSVRGFLAGVVRKRLKLDLESGLSRVSGSIGSRLSKARGPQKQTRTAASPDHHAASQDRCGGRRDLLRRRRDRTAARSRRESVARPMADKLRAGRTNSPRAASFICDARLSPAGRGDGRARCRNGSLSQTR